MKASKGSAFLVTVFLAVLPSCDAPHEGAAITDRQTKGTDTITEEDTDTTSNNVNVNEWSDTEGQTVRM